MTNHGRMRRNVLMLAIFGVLASLGTAFSPDSAFAGHRSRDRHAWGYRPHGVYYTVHRYPYRERIYFVRRPVYYREAYCDEYPVIVHPRYVRRPRVSVSLTFSNAPVGYYYDPYCGY